jgi:uncharacterized protein with PIN domain
MEIIKIDINIDRVTEKLSQVESQLDRIIQKAELVTKISNEEKEAAAETATAINNGDGHDPNWVKLGDCPKIL